MFPFSNTIDDGVAFASPVDSFPVQNAFGLYNMIGMLMRIVIIDFECRSYYIGFFMHRKRVGMG